MLTSANAMNGFLFALIFLQILLCKFCSERCAKVSLLVAMPHFVSRQSFLVTLLFCLYLLYSRDVPRQFPFLGGGVSRKNVTNYTKLYA